MEHTRIGSFGIMNNPVYREEPWKESIEQRLRCFDVVCLVCGNEADLTLLADTFPQEWNSGKLKAVYKQWPFPQWSYEELPRHLNAALSLAREQDCRWMVRLDIDTLFHEKDIRFLKRAVRKAEQRGKWVVSLRKLQFFKPTKYFKKAFLPLGIDVTKPIAYGVDELQKNDLCQPIVWDGSTMAVFQERQYDIPQGKGIERKKTFFSRRSRLFNYDFTFRTYERSIELLYEIECAHARFWGVGYSGRSLSEITRASAMKDFLDLSRQRFRKMSKSLPIKKHPIAIQDRLTRLTAQEWGYDLWKGRDGE